MFVKEIIKIAREDNLNVNRCVIRYFKKDKEIKRITIKISKKIYQNERKYKYVG
ncbi:hypothetical protein MSIBF_A1360020 [groundwater metagenome]|uniref:Uncharacterized protein n=1 Tax=groundwater metagenome TaxID=717931 RepID=A0A098E8H8_9ZZZZ